MNEPKTEDWTIIQSLKYITIVVVLSIILYLLLDNFGLLWIAANGSKLFLEMLNIPTTVTFNYVAFYSPQNQIFISGNGFDFQIINACAAIEGLVLISALIFATPTSWKRKGLAHLFFVPSLLFANFFRISLTIIMYLNGFSIFVAHEVIAAALTVIFIFIFVIIINTYIIKNFIDSMINFVKGFYDFIVKRSNPNESNN
ncbi:MAG: hypothetical protein ACTSVY_05330 [Candidatus Helarchaeota archaeon]